MSASPDDSSDLFTQALAARLKQLKDASPYSVRSLAKAAGLGDATVRRYLDAEREIPTSTLRRLAELLGVKAADLMDQAEDLVALEKKARRTDSE